MTQKLKEISLFSATSKAVRFAAVLGCTVMATTAASAALMDVPPPSEKMSLLEVVGVKGLAPDTLPEPTKRAVPRYPFRALEDNREGWVIVQLDVDAGGKPANAQVVEAVGGPYFNRSSLQALKKFRFKPATLEGKAVAVTNVRYKFTYALIDHFDG